MDDRALPELTEGLLDPPTLRQLFADLTAHADAVEVRLKDRPGRRAQAGLVSLDDAREALLSGAVRGAQIRYFWDGQAWIDTLIRAPGGARLCRMQVSG